MIIWAKRGRNELTDQIIAETYPGRKINISNPLDPDYQRPRFLPVSDAFDYVEGVIIVALSSADGLPRKKTLNEISLAVRQAHDDVREGFKADFVNSPSKYGIVENKELKDLLEGLRKTNRRVLMLTSSKRNKPDKYIATLLDRIGIYDCFDAVLTGYTKPGCFYFSHKHNARLTRVLASLQIKGPAETLVIGDNWYKDGVSPGSVGYNSCIRLPRTDIINFESELEEATSATFVIRKPFKVLETRATEKELLEVSNFASQLYRHVDILVPKIHYLSQLLLR